LSTVRTSVIEHFLAAIATDEAVPMEVASELRELLTAAGVSDGKLPSTDQIVTVIRTHASAQPSTGSTA
jgi:hypothetical protein